MNSSRLTKELIESIKKQEEQKYTKYGLIFNIENPTIVKYYIDNIKLGNFNPRKQNFNEIKYRYYLGSKANGFASFVSNSICIFDRDYDNYIHFLNIPIKDLDKRMPYQKATISFTTFHEIRHILQYNGYELSPYEFFCCRNLSDYNGPKALTNRKYHDSLFNEIDANLYGATEAKKYLTGNKAAEKYFNELIGIYSIQKYTFDFDLALEKYQQKNEQNKCKLGGMLYLEHFIWNFNGTFKRPKDIIKDHSFHDYQKDFASVSEFYDRVISSNAYLSRLNIDQLDKEEIDFIETAIKGTISVLESNKYKINNLFKMNIIDEYQCNKSIEILNNKIKEKRAYINQKLKKETNANKEESTVNNITEVNLDDLLKPEPRKKIKLITKAKDRLKSIIDKVTRIKTGYVVLGSLYLMELMGLLTNSPELLGLSAATFGASVVASEIYKSKSNR